MTLPLYPDVVSFGIMGLGYNVKWSPVYFNQSQKTMSGASVDIGLAQYPLHQFELTYEFLRGSASIFGGGNELPNMLGFFLALGGSLGRFLFLNPDDNVVASQFIAQSDGVTDAWPMLRTFGPTSHNNFTEPVGYVNTAIALETWFPAGFPGVTAATNVYDNGSPMTLGTDYVIDNSFPGQPMLSLMTIPATGHNITADFGYYYYCQFQDDTTTFEKFSNQLWLNQSIKIQSCRTGA